MSSSKNPVGLLLSGSKDSVQHVSVGFQYCQAPSGVHLPGKHWRRGGEKGDPGVPGLSMRKHVLETIPEDPMYKVGQRGPWLQQGLNGKIRLCYQIFSHILPLP